MKPYIAQNHLSILGILVLVVGSIISGGLIGALAYFISNLFYLILVFPLLVGGVTALAYYLLMQLARVRFTLIQVVMGFIMGLCVALGFYGAPYIEMRNNFINDAQKNYLVDVQTASKGFDNALTKETGSSGLVGYMKLRAQEGDSYTSFVVINSLPVNESTFTIQSTWAWMYWAIELILMAIPSALSGFYGGRKPFNRSANDWYDWSDLSRKQIGSAALENKEKLGVFFQTNNLTAISELLVPEGAIPHPVLEIYEQRSKNKKGDILLTIKQTFQADATKVKRKILSQWEIPPEEYSFFSSAVRQIFLKENSKNKIRKLI
jgi:hypothetical protein